MNDTPLEVAARYRQLLMAKSPAERAEMACDMCDAAWEMAIAGIRARLGDLDAGELRAQLFLQLYGRDFEPERARRITERLRGWKRQVP